MPDDLPNIRRAIKELRAEYRDVEVLRLQRRCQELYSQVKRLQRELSEERGETRRVA